MTNREQRFSVLLVPEEKVILINPHELITEYEILGSKNSMGTVRKNKKC